MPRATKAVGVVSRFAHRLHFCSFLSCFLFFCFSSQSRARVARRAWRREGPLVLQLLVEVTWFGYFKKPVVCIMHYSLELNEL
jgi:hypothetical protein